MINLDELWDLKEKFLAQRLEGRLDLADTEKSRILNTHWAVFLDWLKKEQKLKK